MAGSKRAIRRAWHRLQGEHGIALMLTLMITVLLSALMVGFVTAVIADQRSSGVDRDQSQVYFAAHAGMEKLTSDLSSLFSTDYSPSGAQINALDTHPPSISGFTYVDPDGSSGYKVVFTADGSGNPVPQDPTTGTTIAAGPYQGFKGIVTHYNIMVTARSTGGAEVRMRRELQTVAVPVFQFGLFSESSLAFHSADDFNFGGRIHTNGNLYLAEGSGGTLTLGDKVTAVGEVVRKYLDNGLLSTSLYPGTVKMAKGTNVYRTLASTEGSVVNNVGSAANEPTWTNLSVGTYNGYIRNGRTGAKTLSLPLVSNGAAAIDLIRRPVASEDTNLPLIYQQRYYSQASLRILLSDTAADITSLPTVTSDTPVSLESGSFNGVPIGMSAGTGTSPYKSNAGVSLIGGYIKIEMQKSDGTWQDVTTEILNLGIAGRNMSTGTLNSPGSPSTCGTTEPQPNAVIRLERIKDVPTYVSPENSGTYRSGCGYISASPNVLTTNPYNYWPLSLYDTREGLRRAESTTSNLYPSGTMYYVELDTANLGKWFKGTIGASGTQAKNDNGGYIVYFSDRRNNRNSDSSADGWDSRFAAQGETGEFGYEDIINSSTSSGVDDSTLETPEDVNTDGHLQTYGKFPSYGGTWDVVPPGAASPLDSTARANTALSGSSTNIAILRGNRPLFFRRALKLTDGSNLYGAFGSGGGLTIASENPVYVQGNYNSSASNTPTENHIAASVIADAVSVLSNAWNDIASFTNGYGSGGHGNMAASNTGYRFAAVTGKNISFTHPSGWSAETNFGMDGGAHNLLRQQEDWSSRSIYYRGSLVSFYISRQATGAFKYNGYIYSAPSTRVYNFDTDFLLPDKLPPGTPMFRDVNTLTFRQLLRPNQ